jgi:hypothetical protein
MRTILRIDTERARKEERGDGEQHQASSKLNSKDRQASQTTQRRHVRIEQDVQEGEKGQGGLPGTALEGRSPSTRGMRILGSC